MESNEGAPLLADPPIDDDSYRQEARSFPSDEQRQLLFATFGVSGALTRVVEAGMTLLLIMTFTKNLVPVSLYCLAGVGLTMHIEGIMIRIARSFRSRLRLLIVAVIQQRIASVIFLLLLLRVDWSQNTELWVRALLFSTMVMSTVWLRAGLYLYQRTFRADWLMALASTQENIRFRFERIMHSYSLITQMVCPIALSTLVLALGVKDVGHFLIFLSVCGLLVETSLVYKLYTTCYALHLPRNELSLDCGAEDSAIEFRSIAGIWQPSSPGVPAPATVGIVRMGSSTNLPVRSLRHYSPFPSQPLSRVYKYVRRKSVPVAITTGTLFITSASLIMIQPATGWFFLSQGMNPVAMYILKMIQVLITLHPAIPARRSFALAAIGTLVCLPFLYLSLHSEQLGLLWTYLFAVCLLVARAGSPMIVLIGDEFIKEYLDDEEVLKVYKENAMWLRINCEVAVQALTLIWPQRQNFFWPVLVSAILTFVGIFIVLMMIHRHWASINHR